MKRVMPGMSHMWIGLVALLGVGLNSLNGASQPLYSPAAEAGRTIFNGKGMCSGCHGIDADGKSDLEPLVENLQPVPANLRNLQALKYQKEEEMFRFIKERVHGPVTDDEIWKLIAFLREIRKN